MSPSMRRHLAVAALAATASATFDPNSKTNVAVYWGQGPNQAGLIETCKNPNIDIVNIGFINAFPDNSPGSYPGSNFGNACGSATYTVNGVSTLLQSGCTTIASDITACQMTYGKKVLLSLGGAAPLNYYMANDTSATNFADFLWGAFGPQTSAWTNAGKPRPFGTAVVDGFDFDIESEMSPPPNDASGNAISDYQSRGYMALIQQLKNNNFPTDTSKSYYISGAPVCGLPDAHLSFAIQYAWFDFIFVQFYNNAACSGRAAVNYAAGDSFLHWTQAPSKNPNAKIYFGLPASPFASGATSDYLTQSEAQGLVQRFSGSARWGGIMLWEATYSQYNVACSKDYATWMKNILVAVMSGKTVDTDLSKCSPTATALPAPGPTQSGIPSTCNKYLMANNDPGRSCSIFANRAGITPQQLYQWNPVLGNNGQNCGSQFLGNEWYCVGVSEQTAAPAPGPTQSGIINTCTGYLMANPGGTCPVFANRAGITTAQLYKWNPVLGPNGENCATSFWANEYYCVAISSSSAAPSTTMKPTATAAPAPGPTQSGIIDTCNKYLMANNDPGRSCSIFANRAGITEQQLYQWNSVLGNNGQNCPSQFLGNTWYCVGVRNNSKRDLSAYGAAPLTTAAPSASSSPVVFGEDLFTSLSAYLMSVATISTEYTGLSTSTTSSTEAPASTAIPSSTESPVKTTSAAPVYPSAYGGGASSSSSVAAPVSVSSSSAAVYPSSYGTLSSSSPALVYSSSTAASSYFASSSSVAAPVTESSSFSTTSASSSSYSASSSTLSGSASSVATSASASSYSSIASPVTASSSSALSSYQTSVTPVSPYSSANQTTASGYSSTSSISSAISSSTSSSSSTAVPYSSSTVLAASSSIMVSYVNTTSVTASSYSSPSVYTSASSIYSASASSSSVVSPVTGSSSSSVAYSYAPSTSSTASAETTSAALSSAFSYAPTTSPATTASPSTITEYSTSINTVTSCLPGVDCSSHPESQTTIYSTSTVAITKTIYPTSYETEASATEITTAPVFSASPSTITSYSTSIATVTSCLPGTDCASHPESQTTIYSTSTVAVTKTLYPTSYVTEALSATAAPSTITSYSTSVATVTSCLPGADCASHPESKTTILSTSTLAITETLHPTSYVTMTLLEQMSTTGSTSTTESTSTTYVTETITLTRSSGTAFASASSAVPTAPASYEAASSSTASPAISASTPAYSAPASYGASSVSEASPATAASSSSLTQAALSSYAAPSGYASPSDSIPSSSLAAPVKVSTFYVIPVQSMPPSAAPYGSVNGTATATGTGIVMQPTYSGAPVTPYTGAAWRKSISLGFVAVVVGASLFVL